MEERFGTMNATNYRLIHIYTLNIASLTSTPGKQSAFCCLLGDKANHKEFWLPYQLNTKWIS
ncbi:MAG: hypothetical protein ACI8QD_000875 [Cyclobacteriaceae bacterium]|jgi:hypothetical protein